MATLALRTETVTWVPILGRLTRHWLAAKREAEVRSGEEIELLLLHGCSPGRPARPLPRLPDAASGPGAPQQRY